MLARRGCASRICLSCHFTLARSEVVARRFPRPHRIHSNSPNVRLLSSSLSLKEGSKGIKDAPTDDPFAALEVARRQGTSSPELSKSQKRRSKTPKARKKKREDPVPEWGLATGTKSTPATTSPPTAAPINEATTEPNQNDGQSQDIETEQEEPSLDTSTAEIEASEASPSETSGTLNDSHELEDQPIETTPARSNGRSAPRQDIQRLQVGVEALGQPGGAIILDNPDVLSQRRTPVWDIPQEAQGVHGLDIKLPDASVTKESIMAEAIANIEELNLRDSRELGEKEFQRHRDSLATSFTAAQLEAYLKASTEAENVFLVPDSNKTTRDSTAKSAVEWRLFRPSTPITMTKKQRLAHDIITRAWNVETSASSNLGFMHLEVDPDLYEVLAHPATGALDFAKARLDDSDGETISFDLPKPTIEIRCVKSSARGVLNRIKALKGGLMVAKPNMQGLSGHQLSWPWFIDEVSRITRTAIISSESGIKLRWIDFLQPESKSSAVESKEEIVMRLLRGKDDQPKASNLMVIPLDGEEGLSKCTHIPHSFDTRSFSLPDRQRPWTRWTAPSVKSALDPSPNQRPLSLVMQLPTTRWPAPAPQTPHTRHLTASFGHVLSSVPKAPKAGGRVDRIFASLMPHPAAFNAMVLEAADVQKSAFILLKFTTPIARETGKTTPPYMYLKLPVSPDSDFSNFSLPEDASLYAEKPKFVVDALIPENPVDVRLDMTDRLELVLSEQRGVLEFFQASEFNLAEGRLQTPPNVDIRLPHLRRPGHGKETPKVVRYDFAGLEVHQVAKIPWQDQLLVYSSIEAGQQGGSRQQLTVEQQHEQGEPTAAFLDAVDAIATGRVFPWADGQKLMVEDKTLGTAPENITFEPAPADENDAQQVEAVEDNASTPWEENDVPRLSPDDTESAPLVKKDAQEAQALEDDTPQAWAESHGVPFLGPEAAEKLGIKVKKPLEKMGNNNSPLEKGARQVGHSGEPEYHTPASGDEPEPSTAVEGHRASSTAQEDWLAGASDVPVTSPTGEEAAEPPKQEVSDFVSPAEEQPAIVTSTECEAVLEQGQQLISSASDSLVSAKEFQDTTVDDQPPRDKENTTQLHLQATSTATSTEATNTQQQPAESMAVPEPEAVEKQTKGTDSTDDGAGPVTKEIPKSSPPVQKRPEPDVSSPWGHAWSLFK